MQPNNRAKAFLQAVVSFLIVLVLVVILEVLAHPPAPGNPQGLAAFSQAPASPTAEIKMTDPPPVRSPARSSPLSATAAGGQGVQTATPLSTLEPTRVPQPTVTQDLAVDWTSLPVIPAVSETARAIYQRGLAMGNHPNAFSKVGDCNALSTRYLTYFDGTPASTYYNLESFSSLQEIIDQFSGSFKRESQAVGDGFNTSAILSPFRADPNFCDLSESPLECEYRIQRPSFALITIGTDDYLKPADFEDNLRKIVEITVNNGIVPILATKADNANQLNYNPIIAAVAEEFDVPLWNLWLAQQLLPEQGLLDNVHPTGTFAAFDFTPSNLETYGWPVRNLTALQVLEAVWQGVTQ